ncbi:hypothetical protein N7U49_46400 [Streptomyces sp. AD2-2]|nr:hypothetical protein N7U49_46400 [Streptomyces sp. AD2-2]
MGEQERANFTRELGEAASEIGPRELGFCSTEVGASARRQLDSSPLPTEPSSASALANSCSPASAGEPQDVWKAVYRTQ